MTRGERGRCSHAGQGDPAQTLSTGGEESRGPPQCWDTHVPTHRTHSLCCVRLGGVRKPGQGMRGLLSAPCPQWGEAGSTQLKIQHKGGQAGPFPKTAMRGNWKWDRRQRNPREREKGWIQSTEKGELERHTTSQLQQ